MSLRAFLVLTVVLFSCVVACGQDPQHHIKVSVEVKPASQPGFFKRLFGKKEQPAQVVMVPLTAIPEAAKVATLTALVSGAPAAQPTPAAKVMPTVEVKVNKP